MNTEKNDRKHIKDGCELGLSIIRGEIILEYPLFFIMHWWLNRIRECQCNLKLNEMSI